MLSASHLHAILGKLQIRGTDRVEYTSHAVMICNEIMENLQKLDYCFRNAFNGLSVTGSYLDRVKLKTPDEFDMHMKLKFPFQVQPVRDDQRVGFVFLHAPSGNSHPAVNDGYVSNKAIQSWLRASFKKVSYNILLISGERYNLKYELKGYGCSHTIVASSANRTISFDFFPVLEYDYNNWPLPHPLVSEDIRQKWPWFAVPQKMAPSSERTFMVCAPHWEREMMDKDKDKDNLKNVLRLMKALRDVHKDDLPHLSSYMLKTVILLELTRNENFWKKDLGLILVEMWAKLCEYFDDRNLPFFLANDCNHFNRLNEIEFQKCKLNCRKILCKLNYLANSPDYHSVERLFL